MVPAHTREGDAVTGSVAEASLIEVPVLFPAGDETMFGVVTSPEASSPTTGIILLTGGAWIPSINRNRLWVRLARRLAARGYHVLRFDYHGVGESTGSVKLYRNDRPFTDDLLGAVACLRDRGIDRFILIGICFGVRTAMAAVRDIDGLAGMLLLTPPIADSEGSGAANKIVAEKLKSMTPRSLARLLMDRSKWYLIKRTLAGRAAAWRSETRRRMQGAQRPEDDWVSEHFLDHLKGAIEKRVPLLLVWGEDDQNAGYNFYDIFLIASYWRIGELLTEAGDLLEIKLLPGAVHALLEISTQESIIETAEEWLSRLDSNYAGTNEHVEEGAWMS